MFFLKSMPSQRMVDGYATRFEHADPAKVTRALGLMRSASLLIRELEAYFASRDLSQLRFLTLILIDREPDRTSLTASEIAERLDVSRPVVTRTLRSLEAAGLIESAPHASDARSRDVSLTATGQDMLEQVLPGYFAILHRAMSEDQQ